MKFPWISWKTGKRSSPGLGLSVKTEGGERLLVSFVVFICSVLDPLVDCDLLYFDRPFQWGFLGQGTPNFLPWTFPLDVENVVCPTCSGGQVLLCMKRIIRVLQTCVLSMVKIRTTLDLCLASAEYLQHRCYTLPFHKSMLLRSTDCCLPLREAPALWLPPTYASHPLPLPSVSLLLHYSNLLYRPCCSSRKFLFLPGAQAAQAAPSSPCFP